MTGRLLPIALIVSVLSGCGARDLTPVALDTGHATCSYCRMGVTDQRFASQLLVPGDEPRFFDDLSCLSHYLADTPQIPPQTRVYVADHRTQAWIPAERAVYTQVTSLTAAMGSHIIAHEDAASRAADPEAALGTAMDAQAVFGGRLSFHHGE